MIELLLDIPGLPDNAVAFSGKGEIVASDYETVLIPAIDKKLKTHKKVRILFHLGPEFTGYSMGAMWDDTKMGLEHMLSWEKLAIVSDKEWIRHLSKFFGFMAPHLLKVYSNDQLDEAIEWIREI